MKLWLSSRALFKRLEAINEVSKLGGSLAKLLEGRLHNAKLCQSQYVG